MLSEKIEAQPQFYLRSQNWPAYTCTNCAALGIHLKSNFGTTLPSHNIATLRSRLSYAWIGKDNKRHGSRCKQNERSRQLGRGLGALNATRP